MIDFTLDQIANFLAVVDHGSFSGAAAAQNRAQSAVSLSVQKLEEKLGATLFDRSGYRPTLTAAGRTLLPQARRIAEDVSGFQGLARGLAGEVETELSIAIDSLCSTEPLTGVLAQLQQRYPSLRIRCYSRMMDEILALLADGSADICILSLYGNAPVALERLPLFRLELYMVASPDHPLAGLPPPLGPHLLRQYVQLVLVDRTGLVGPRDYGVHSPSTWRCEKLEHMLPLLRGGIGFGIATAEAVADDLAAGRLVRLQPEIWEGDLSSIALPIHAVWRPDRQLGPAAQWLLAHLRQLPALSE